MTYGELSDYIDAAAERAATTSVPYMVQLQRKVAFPFVTLIMTLLAVPFAVTTGPERRAVRHRRRHRAGASCTGPMLSVFGAMGARRLDVAGARGLGAEHPVRRPAPIYMMLTVRT